MNRKMSITKSQLHQYWKKRLEGTNLDEEIIRYKDTDYFLEGDSDLDGDTVIYEKVIKAGQNDEGRLNWGYICVYPGRVKDQYFCTRGHFNSNPKAEEYLLCMQGEGLIMFLDEQGNCWCEMLEEGSLHHVDAGLAYRLINLGKDELMLSFCRPANTHPDHDRLKTYPFPCHVYEDQGEMAIYVDVEDSDPEDGKAQDEKEQTDALEALLRS